MQRMRTMTAVAVGAAALAAGGCKSIAQRNFAEPIVTFKDVKVNGVGLTGGSLDVLLNIYNPNHYRLDATRFTYKLLVNDTTEFGTGAIDQRFTVHSKDSTVVRLPLDFKWTGANAAVREIMNTGSVNYRVTGDITVGTPLGNYTTKYDQRGRFSSLTGASRP